VGEGAVGIRPVVSKGENLYKELQNYMEKWLSNQRQSVDLRVLMFVSNNSQE